MFLVKMTFCRTLHKRREFSKNAQTFINLQKPARGRVKRRPGRAGRTKRPGRGNEMRRGPQRARAQRQAPKATLHRFGIESQKPFSNIIFSSKLLKLFLILPKFPNVASMLLLFRQILAKKCRDFSRNAAIFTFSIFQG